MLETADQLDAEVHLDPSCGSRGRAQLAYRIVREGLRNVVKHAAATTAWWRYGVRRAGCTCSSPMTGGSRPAAWTRWPLPARQHEPRTRDGPREGHLGLRLLRDSVQDAGGSLELLPNRPQGTRLRARFLEDVPGF